MKISLQWLRDYINLDGLSPDEISDSLTLLGLEVDSLEQVGNQLDGVVIGLVESVAQHPNADRLKVCQVNLGTESVQIVCGASNVAAGQKVPVATVGSVLPTTDGSVFKIKKGKLRGEVSMGMICAEDELGLGANHDGIMVFDDADNSLIPGTHISNVIELWNDHVFDIELTPNRPDASCHFGVARDLAAKYQEELSNPLNKDFEAKLSIVNAKSGHSPDISIENEQLCHRYVGIRMENVQVRPSPTWLVNRLESIGLRSINNVVDATNYVMMTLGQPLHAFDANLITSGKVVIKNFDQEMNFTTLDGQERKVPATSLFICDQDKPIALAGIMGGENSEVSESTSNILIESAYFDPVSVRKTSKALALQTDSSYRFERGIDPNGCLDAAIYCASLIADLANGNVSGDILDLHPIKTAPKTLTLRPDFANRILGLALSPIQMDEILGGLGFDTKLTDGEIQVSVPTFRPDVEREIDLVEEIVRVYDINAIPTPTTAPYIRPADIPELEIIKERLKSLSVGLGFQEIYTNSLLPESEMNASDAEHHVRTLNPLSSEMSVLRDQLESGMLKSMAHNYKRNATSMKFFEIGNIFKLSGSNEGSFHKGILEETILQLSISGKKSPKNWNSEAQDYDFFDLKSLVLSLLQGLGVQVDTLKEEVIEGKLLFSDRENELVQLHSVSSKDLKKWKIKKNIFTARFSVSALIEAANLKRKYVPIAKTPPAEFDMAFVMDKNTSAGAVASTIRQSIKQYLVDLQIFDIYEGDRIAENKKSVAYRLQVQSDETLTAKDIESIIKKVSKRLLKEHEAELRDE